MTTSLPKVRNQVWSTFTRVSPAVFAVACITGCGGVTDAGNAVPSASSAGGTNAGGTPATMGGSAGAITVGGSPGSRGTVSSGGAVASVGGGSSGGASGITVHEWGTYTSVHATDGHALGGVHHVDEALPSWVYRRHFTPYDYYFETLPEEPLEQLETPVLYFHSDHLEAVKVEVSFPEGLVSEWYPDASGFLPPMNGITQLAGGAMTWDVTLDPAINPSSFLAVSPEEIWAPSRNVASTPVRFTPAAGTPQTEQFIFYRGLAKFAPPFRTSVAADGTITLVNASPESISAVFLLRTDATGGAFVSLGELAAGGQLTHATPSIDTSMLSFLGAAHLALETALMGTGLYADEAQAMVDTWTRSWFQNVGLRVLYLAPRAWTEKWLPTKITPAPSEFTRTLVGRVELLTVAEEQQLVSDISAAASADAIHLTSLGRFAEPRVARALEQLSDPAALQRATTLHQNAHSMP